MSKPTYIIFAFGYSEEVGGVLALHKLCDVLRKSGRNAYIWPVNQAVPPEPSRKERFKHFFRRKKPHPSNLPINPAYQTPIASGWELRRKNTIVIYPEVVPGNPLGAKHVVRWFLNKPGRLTGQTNYGNNELYFFYQEAFNDPNINPHSDNKLLIITVMDDIYKQTNFGARSGNCYILRKGKDRAPAAASLNGIVIDNLPHKQIAKIFNESENCISYDMYTMYSAYASMCGCNSIVVPEPGMDKEKWQPIKELTNGIAYGMENVESAAATRSKMIANYKSMENDNIKTVNIFAKKCEDFFFTKRRSAP